MIEPMHADINDEVARFVSLVLRTFDPSRYPRLEDGAEFDVALQRVENAFLGAAADLPGLPGGRVVGGSGRRRAHRRRSPGARRGRPRRIPLTTSPSPARERCCPPLPSQG